MPIGNPDYYLDKNSIGRGTWRRKPVPKNGGKSHTSGIKELSMDTPGTTTVNGYTFYKTSDLTAYNSTDEMSYPSRNLRGVNLDGANLSGLDLSGIDFTGASLVGANLDGAIMKGSILNEVDLTGASMGGAMLTDTSGRGANFTDAVANYMIMDAVSFERSNFTGANIANSYITNSSFPNSVFVSVSAENTSWTRVIADHSNFTGATFANANFSDTHFWGSDVTDANFSNLYTKEFDLRDTNITSEQATRLIDSLSALFTKLPIKYDTWSFEEVRQHLNMPKEELRLLIWTYDVEVRDNQTGKIVTGSFDADKHHIPGWEVPNLGKV